MDLELLDRRSEVLVRLDALDELAEHLVGSNVDTLVPNLGENGAEVFREGNDGAVGDGDLPEYAAEELDGQLGEVIGGGEGGEALREMRTRSARGECGNGSGAYKGVAESLCVHLGACESGLAVVKRRRRKKQASLLSRRHRPPLRAPVFASPVRRTHPRTRSRIQSSQSHGVNGHNTN